MRENCVHRRLRNSKDALQPRLDHRRSDVAHTRPHRAGCPVAGPAVAISIHVRPVRAAEVSGAGSSWCIALHTPYESRPAPALVEGVREHAWGVRWVAGPAPHPCGWVLVDLGLGARLEMLLSRRRIHAARPSSVRRCSYAPASCGLPCGWSGGGHFYSCAARPGRRGLRIAGGIHAASVLAAYHHPVGGVLPPTFNAGCERVVVRAGACCRRGVRDRRRLLSKACANTRGEFDGWRGRRRIHAAGSWLIWDWVRGLRCCCRRRRIHAARPSSVRRCSYAPASCGLPCGWSGGGHFYSCAARPGRRGFAHCRRHPCRLGSRCEPPLGRRRPAADLQCPM